MMRAAFVFLTALALAPFTPVAAQQSVPVGSYLQSCNNIVLSGTLMTASCNRPSSGTNRTTIDLRSCPSGNIANVNGTLACNGANSGNGYLPQGSYLQSCRNISKRRHVLSATCTSPQGSAINSSLDLHRCGHGSLVANNNGYLSCGASGNGGWNGSLPQGSYLASCTNVAMSGSVLSASCSAANGQPVQSSLNTNRCQWNSGIRNTNGRLDCASYR